MRIQDYQISKTLCESKEFNVHQVYHVLTNKKYCMFEIIENLRGAYSSPSLKIEEEFTCEGRNYVITNFFDMTLQTFAETLTNYDKTSMYALIAQTTQDLLNMVGQRPFYSFRLDNIFIYQKVGERQEVLFGLNEILQDDIFCAPETCNGQQGGEPSQVWAVGIVLYYLCHRQTPYDAFRGQNVKELIKQNQLTPPARSVHELFVGLLQQMLKYEAGQRLSLYLLVRAPVFKRFVKV